LDTKLDDLTRAIQADGDPTSDTLAADPHGFRSRIIRIANDLYNMQRPDRRTRLMAGDDLMALAEEMRAAFQTQDAEIVALKSPFETLGAQVSQRAEPDMLAPAAIEESPVAIEPTPKPAKHEKARA
jgi:hypothetical protein